MTIADIKKLGTTTCTIHCLFAHTSENPCEFSLPFEFAKLVSKIRNEIIYKSVANNLIEKIEFPKPAKMSTL